MVMLIPFDEMTTHFFLLFIVDNIVVEQSKVNSQLGWAIFIAKEVEVQHWDDVFMSIFLFHHAQGDGLLAYLNDCGQ